MNSGALSPATLACNSIPSTALNNSATGGTGTRAFYTGGHLPAAMQHPCHAARIGARAELTKIVHDQAIGLMSAVPTGAA